VAPSTGIGINAPSASWRERMTVPVILSDFQPIVLAPPVAQDVLMDWLAESMAFAHGSAGQSAAASDEVRARMQRLMTRYGVSSRHISQRQANVVAPAASDGGFELLLDPTGDGLDKRMELFDHTAYTVFKRGYQDPGLQPPDDLVHVSTSGYLLPSPAQRFVSDRGWFDTAVTHSYHMGCYGAFPAIRTALGLIGSSYASLPQAKQRVDIVHTEFLSLHFDILTLEPEQLVVKTLFGDGFVKYSAYPATRFSDSGKRGLRILALQDYIIPDSLEKMTLKPGPRLHDMQLDRAVPKLIRESIRGFVTSLCKQTDIDFDACKSEMAFAIHPGGPAILDVVRDTLGIEERQIAASRAALYEHGNMASASAPHIWQEIVVSDDVPVGSLVLSVAFGPGLTATGAIFKKV
jgi:alkylresorcinol/alkylpyrone synthase